MLGNEDNPVSHKVRESVTSDETHSAIVLHALSEERSCLRLLPSLSSDPLEREFEVKEGSGRSIIRPLCHDSNVETECARGPDEKR